MSRIIKRIIEHNDITLHSDTPVTILWQISLYYMPEPSILQYALHFVIRCFTKVEQTSGQSIITICPWRCQHFIFVNDYCIHFNTFKYTVYQGLCCFPQADQVGRPRQQQISLHIPHPSETSVLYEASFQPVTRTENHLNDAWFPINMFCFEYLKYLYWDTYKK